MIKCLSCKQCCSQQKKKRNFGVLPLLADTQKESRKKQEKMLATGLSTGLALRPLFRQVFLFCVQQHVVQLHACPLIS